MQYADFATYAIVCALVFSKLGTTVRSMLFSIYCSSRYGCEIWSIDNIHINEFGMPWRKAARRVLKLPPDTHNSLIPLLLNSRIVNNTFKMHWQ